MNLNRILELEKTKGRDMAAWELCQLLQHKLQNTVVHLRPNEVAQLERVLAQYRKEWNERYGTPVALQQVPVECLVSNCNSM